MGRAILANSVRQAIAHPMIDQARSGKLSMPAIQRGGFIISSLAQYDVTFFAAISNPTQAGMMNFGKTGQRLHLGKDSRTRAKQAGVVGRGVGH